MRILFCNYEYPPLGGGGGVANAALARELAKRHRVVVLTSRALGLPGESVEDGVRVLRARVLARRAAAAATFTSMGTYALTGTRRGATLLRHEPFDVINTHFALPTGPVGYALSRMFAIPNVLSVHGGDLYDPSKCSSAHRHAVLRACVRRIVLAADAVVAPSHDTAANLRRFYAPQIEPAIIPLGIVPPPAARAARADYRVGADDVVMITIGRLVKRKSVDRLVDLVAALGNPRVKLVVVGSGPMDVTWRAYARTRGVESQVLFTGTVTEEHKYELLSIADIYVSTSQHEGFGLVYVEAMAMGLPVLCYARGGQTDFLGGSALGQLVPFDDFATFVNRCAYLIAHPERRALLGRRNAATAPQYFIERCANRYEALFESLLRRRAAPASRLPMAQTAPPK